MSLIYLPHYIGGLVSATAKSKLTTVHKTHTNHSTDTNFIIFLITFLLFNLFYLKMNSVSIEIFAFVRSLDRSYISTLPITLLRT